MKTKSLLLILPVAMLLCFFALVKGSWAAGSATVSWTAPTKNADDSTLTDLAGYKVLYDTSSHWASSCSTSVGTVQDVADDTVADYFFKNTLTPGSTYYFAVVAYDDSGNVSDCATTSGGATEVSKVVTYSGDINATPDNSVDGLDFSILTGVYGQTLCTTYSDSISKADINHDCAVDGLDFSIMTTDYGKSF